MKILYYTSGVTGSGRVVQGISIGNALRRKGIDARYTILSSSSFAGLADGFGIEHREISMEAEEKLTDRTYPDSKLYAAISSSDPDVLIVDLLWFPLYHFIDRLRCKKIFLWKELDPRFFAIDLPTGRISFKAASYDLVVAIEPFAGQGPERQINPLIIRDREEILPRSEALAALKLKDSERNCLLAINAHPGDFEKARERYSYLAQSGYRMAESTNYHGGIFPAVDYFNAFDLIVCGASYNSFWEVVYFDKEAIFFPVQSRFLDGSKYIRKYRDYSFEENGADQLVDILLDLE